MSNNIVTLKGRLTRDVEVNTSKSDTLYGRMSVAVYAATSSKTDDGKAGSGFFEVKFFDKIAKEVAEVKKGTPVVVMGRLMQDKYADKEGVDRTTTYIIADEIVVGNFKESSNTGTAAPAPSAPAKTKAKKDEDDPFADE